MVRNEIWSFQLRAALAVEEMTKRRVALEMQFALSARVLAQCGAAGEA